MPPRPPTGSGASRRRSLRLAGTLVPLLAVLVVAPTASGQGRSWRPDERVLVSDFLRVSALARDESRLYGATGNGLEIYDLIADRWRLPSTLEDGYPGVRFRATALAFDPAERVVWLATEDGALHAYRTDFEEWEERGSPGVGTVRRIVPGRDRREGTLFLGTGRGWFALSTFEGAPRPVPPGSLPEEVSGEGRSAAGRLGEEDPFFRSVRGTVTLDGALRNWPITDYVRDDRAHRYWLGTDGGNVWLYDSRRMDAEPRTFGLLTRGVGALAAGGEGIWHGGDGRGPRRGVTWGSGDLQRWRHHEAGVETVPAGPVHEIVARGGSTWFAAADGLFRHDGASGRWRRVAGDRGLPSDRVLSLALSGNTLWAGTDRGLARIALDPGGGEGGGGVMEVLFPGRRVGAVAPGPGGLWAALPDGPRLVRPGGEPGLPEDTTGGAPPSGVVDLAVGSGELWAATPAALWRWDGAAWHGPLREVTLGGIGRIARLRAEGSALWVAGSGGIARLETESGRWLHLAVGPTIPRGPVADVLPRGEHVWAATPVGSLRIEWTRLR